MTTSLQTPKHQKLKWNTPVKKVQNKQPNASPQIKLEDRVATSAYANNRKQKKGSERKRKFERKKLKERRKGQWEKGRQGKELEGKDMWKSGGELSALTYIKAGSLQIQNVPVLVFHTYTL